MPLRPNVVINTLTNKFHFEPARGRSDDHRWFELKLPDLPPIVTKVSHGRGEISLKIESMMARQLRVRTTFFRGMVDCTNSNENYCQQVRDDPFPPWDHRF